MTGLRQMASIFCIIIILYSGIATSGADKSASPKSIADKTVGIQNSKVSVMPIKDGTVYTGFDVLSGGKIAAAIKFSSNKLITATKYTKSSDAMSIRFSGLSSPMQTGLQFGKSDVITVSLRKDDPYPKIEFHLTLAAFDPVKWQASVGKQPFHFLTIYMPDAEAWHTRGWLNATPAADPFPLLIDPHIGSPEISGYKYNRNWSYTPPLGANPIPIIGLWAPKSKHYAGFEFQSARLSEPEDDLSGKDIATGYCWGDGKATVQKPNPQQFVSMVYPYGGKGYQDLVFPKPGTKLQSFCTLLWSLNLSATDDPNRFFYSYLWQDEMKWNSLPRVPSVVDLSWIPGGIRLNDFGGYPDPRGLVGGVEGPFQIPGSRLISGWGWHNEALVAAPKKLNDQTTLQNAKTIATELLPLAKHFKVEGDDCVFWEKPLSGEWTPEWGGPKTTSLHNSNGFAAGRLFLGLYRDLDMKEYLPIVDGVFNWAKHIVWTRNEFADVPSSPFAIGGTLTASFCMDYYMTFKNAPNEHHRNEAQRALDLAHSFTYRYMAMWLSDNNLDDNMDSSFLWEPNSGRDWTGAACANEVFWNIDTLAQTAVHTGDPILMWALQGTLERWNLMYQDRYRNSLADYGPADMTEGYGLYEGNVYGLGVRALYGFASPLYMTEPIGSSTIRVLAGEKAAMAFNKNGAHTTISDYRYTEPGNLMFTVHSSLSSFDLSLTVPYVDISGKTVGLVRDGKNTALLPGQGFTRPERSLWSLMIKGLKDGDQVIIGTPDANGPILPSAPPMTGRQDLGTAINQTVKLPYDTESDMNWNHLDSWAALPRAKMWVYGIPFQLAPKGEKSFVTKPFDPELGDTNSSTKQIGIALLFSRGTGTAPSVVMEDGTRLSADPKQLALGWRAWPPIFTRQLEIAVIDTKGKIIKNIDPGGRQLWAATLIRSGASDQGTLQKIWQILEAANVQLQALDMKAQIIDSLKAETAGLPQTFIAMLPPSQAGPIIDLAQQIGMSNKVTTMTPDQLVNPAYFNAKRFPVTVFAGTEEYINTVHTPNDAGDAVLNYVKDGGTLVLASMLPWPMFYAKGTGTETVGPLTGKLGISILNTIETEPKEKITVELYAGENVLTDVPASFPYPAGDPRLRSIDSNAIPAGVKYTPIYKVVGSDGKNYGDAAGLLEFQGGGRILYIWGGLMRSPDSGLKVSQSVIRFLAQTASKK